MDETPETPAANQAAANQAAANQGAANQAAADHEAERKRIQRSRSIVMALLLGAFVVLIYAISIAKMS